MRRLRSGRCLGMCTVLSDDGNYKMADGFSLLTLSAKDLEQRFADALSAGGGGIACLAAGEAAFPCSSSSMATRS
jgi:hypothetical protein